MNAVPPTSRHGGQLGRAVAGHQQRAGQEDLRRRRIHGDDSTVDVHLAKHFEARNIAHRLRALRETHPDIKAIAVLVGVDEQHGLGVGARLFLDGSQNYLKAALVTRLPRVDRRWSA